MELKVNEFDNISVVENQIVDLPNRHTIAVYCYTPLLAKNESPKGSIFFVHGVGGCSKIWRHQIKFFLTKMWTVITMDLVGHGNSSCFESAREFEFQNLVYDSLFIFDKYMQPPREPAMNVIVGHSYGCSIMTYIARERPQSVQRMVLISGGSPTPLGSPPLLFFMCNCFLLCLHRIVIKEFRRRAFGKQQRRKYQAKDTGSTNETNVENVESNVVTNSDRVAAVCVTSGVLKWMMRGQIWEEGDEKYHSKVQVPTLLVYGCQDYFVACEEEYEMLSTLPLCTYRPVDGAGHMVMLEQPAEVNRLIWEHILRTDWRAFMHLSSAESPDNNNATGDTEPTPQRRQSHLRKTLPSIKRSHSYRNPHRGVRLTDNQIEPYSTSPN